MPRGSGGFGTAGAAPIATIVARRSAAATRRRGLPPDSRELTHAAMMRLVKRAGLDDYRRRHGSAAAKTAYRILLRTLVFASCAGADASRSRRVHKAVPLREGHVRDAARRAGMATEGRVPSALRSSAQRRSARCAKTTFQGGVIECAVPRAAFERLLRHYQREYRAEFPQPALGFRNEPAAFVYAQRVVEDTAATVLGAMFDGI